MPIEKLPFFLGGLFGVVVLRLIMYAIARHSPAATVAAARTVTTRQFALLILNLAVVATGIYISVYAITIAVEGHTMTPDELRQLIASAQGLLNWVWVIYGGVAAAVLLFLIGFGKAAIEAKNTKGPQKIEIQEKPASPDLPREGKITIDMKINTADIAEMKPEQLKAVNEIIDRLQSNQPRGDERPEQADREEDKSGIKTD